MYMYEYTIENDVHLYNVWIIHLQMFMWSKAVGFILVNTNSRW